MVNTRQAQQPQGAVDASEAWSMELKRPGRDMEVSIVMGVPQNGWFIVENSIQMDDDWGYPHFRKPPYVESGNPTNCMDLISLDNQWSSHASS